jgi:hypothetical protein
MREVRDAVAGILDRTTLAQAVKRASAGKQEKQEALMYYI